ncbi:hypothetical protein [Psychroflexus maritimus]|uniref:Uncharacterized protein n=1 Tax=Psychroflexus maritimus TaxID=2714865 RepID=A0A967DZV6_9FLAO|nr:hypothetical protein [Psychroflexus maritimus]NGZ90618.1 hypothetical protein [Psychroflexus maritimus]
MQNQEMKVYLSSLIQSIENQQKLELIKAYIEQLVLEQDEANTNQVEELIDEINYAFKIK